VGVLNPAHGNKGSGNKQNLRLTTSYAAVSNTLASSDKYQYFTWEQHSYQLRQYTK
jgi:hypothetical protein